MKICETNKMKRLNKIFGELKRLTESEEEPSLAWENEFEKFYKDAILEYCLVHHLNMPTR